VNLLDLLFVANRRTSYQRALQNAHSRTMPDGVSEAHRRIFRELAPARGGFTFGTLGPEGEPVRIGDDAALASALVIGASGSGKTRFILSLLQSAIERSLLPSAAQPLAVDLELVDPKQETFDLLAQYLAARWLTADTATRARIADAVRVIDWSKDTVTPFAPFDNTAGEVSNTYLAFLRTDVAIQAGEHSYSGALRQAFFMLACVLVERRFPLNYRFAMRFLDDEAYRRRILEDVAETDVRAFFTEAKHTLPKQTRDALLRRIQSDMSFPEVRLSVGIPPAELDRFLPRRETPVVLGNYGCSMTLPLAKGKERASYRLIDVLLSAPRRDARRRGLLVIDEAPMLLSEENELTASLMEGARTLRSAGMGILFAAQDFANALPSQIVRALMLNTRWWAVFQSREEAEWIYPHIVRPASDASETEQHREFVRRVQNLRRQHFYLYVKGHSALPLRSADVPDPAIRSAAELRTVFRREIASRSTIAAKTAAELIAKWEADVVDGAALPPAPAATKRRSSRGVDQLLRDLGVDK
jgi:DNA helicase HerA-like ATPase